MTPDERASAAVDEIAADLRDRKTLKWLFCEDQEDAGELWPGVNAISSDVQAEIFATWKEIILRHMTSDAT